MLWATGDEGGMYVWSIGYRCIWMVEGEWMNELDGDWRWYNFAFNFYFPVVPPCHPSRHSIHTSYTYYTSIPTMRQLKHHEQKLLKKVDFLSVGLLPLITTAANQIFSGSRMPRIEKSRWWESTIYKTERITTSESALQVLHQSSWWSDTTSCAGRWGHWYINYHYYRHKTHSEPRKSPRCSTSYTIWASWVRLLYPSWRIHTDDQTWMQNHPISKTS